MEKYKKVIIKHKIKKAAGATISFPFKLAIRNKEFIILALIAIKLWGIESQIEDQIKELPKLLELLK
jgi:hypothetical protein